MIQLALTAFTIGAIGSFHCIGMCGPLALSLPLSGNKGAKFIGAFLYNSGRVVTYSFFGLVFGMIGQSAALFGFQQWLSIIVGALIIVFVIIPKRIGMYSTASVNIFFNKLRSALGRLFFKKNQSSLFVIGLLNGFLPCGLVYMAVAGAIASAGVLNSMVFMAFFGLGTLPVMWSVSYFGNFIGVVVRQKIRKAYPYLMLLMAGLLILRGLGLGIPYISPQMNTNAQSVQSCCPRP
jgi:sulfite exporter TauE/SafE